MLPRAEFIALEAERLAPYAMPSSASAGRQYAEADDDWRTCFQRDRDRLVHSHAFRRLAYKTQVFINEVGDLYRTRLTHTMEVSQLARSAAQVLRLNSDLVECIALAHDLGHPPFGHQGERMLDELMADFGGFEHNRQALRIVESLEQAYPEFDGLNFSYEVREGIIKHQARSPKPVPQRYQPDQGPLLETQLVDAIDSVVYDCHASARRSHPISFVVKFLIMRCITRLFTPCCWARPLISTLPQR